MMKILSLRFISKTLEDGRPWRRPDVEFVLGFMKMSRKERNSLR
jgi:hypothetical protein